MSQANADTLVADPTTDHRKTGNLFLDHLPPCILSELRPHLRRITTTRGEHVSDINEPLKRVLFPIGSIVSVVTQMRDGGIVETGVIGREGMTGLSLALGTPVAAQHAFVQVPDSALSMPATDFESCLQNGSELQSYALRYGRVTLTTVAQFAACNRVHPVSERCARWILMAHDRVPTDNIPLTQDFLAQMLGVRRAGVSVAAGVLQRAGFIAYDRGNVTVTDRAGLESAACECYQAVEREWATVMQYGVRKVPSAQ